MEGRQEMNVDAYLERIGLSRSDVAADVDSLRRLQKSHLLAVPFENLDIHWNRWITLDTEKFYRKIVGERRGGFCYELNGLFNELRVALGFTTKLISARVFDGTVYGLSYGHAAMIVTIGDQEFLVDVGFGDFTAEPLEFILGEKQRDATGTFLVRQFAEEFLEVAKLDGEAWKSQYVFKNKSRELSEFAQMCDFHQWHPDSHFKKGKLCSIMMATGRKTLTDTKFIVTANGEKTENDVDSETDFRRLLEKEFRISQKNDGQNTE